MHAEDLATRIAPAQQLLGYFDQQVLAGYRNEPERYTIQTDSFEGSLTVTNDYYEGLERADRTDEYLDLKFGYRTLTNGELAIVLWLPDLAKAKAHQARWGGFLLRNPIWTDEPDERFERWVSRYLEGSWEIDNGPRFYLSDVLAKINGFSCEMVGIPLYKYPIDSGVTFPAAENTHRYQDAHKNLYGYLVDGLDKTCMVKLAELSNKNERFDNDNTIKAVTRLFPELENSAFLKATSLVSEQRRLSAHAVRPQSQKFPAFETFSRDLELCVNGLKILFQTLENHLGVDGESAHRRTETKRMLPRIEDQVHKNASVHRAGEMKGRTIERVEYGEREVMKGVHGSEAVILHFTDGSILGIDTGSNVRNIVDKCDNVEPEEFHIDFRLSWVPALAKSENQETKARPKDSRNT